MKFASDLSVQSDKLGFHSSSLDLDIPAIESVDVGKGFGKWRQPKGKSGRRSGQGARKWTVDVPMRSFQGGEPCLAAKGKLSS